MCSKHPFEACYGACKCPPVAPTVGAEYHYRGHNVTVTALDPLRNGLHYRRDGSCPYGWARIDYFMGNAVPLTTETGRTPSQPSTQELPAPLNIGSLWRRKRDGRLVTIHVIEPRSPGRDGRVHYKTDSGGGYCRLSRWRESYESVPTPNKECGGKPPLGVKPRKIHDEERANALDEAIDRYLRGDLPIPMEWVMEYNELRERLNKQGV